MRIPKEMIRAGSRGTIADRLGRIKVERYARYDESGINISAIARAFGVSRQAVAKQLNVKELNEWYRNQAYIPVDKED